MRRQYPDSRRRMSSKCHSVPTKFDACNRVRRDVMPCLTTAARTRRHYQIKFCRNGCRSRWASPSFVSTRSSMTGTSSRSNVPAVRCWVSSSRRRSVSCCRPHRPCSKERRHRHTRTLHLSATERITSRHSWCMTMEASTVRLPMIRRH